MNLRWIVAATLSMFAGWPAAIAQAEEEPPNPWASGTAHVQPVEPDPPISAAPSDPAGEPVRTSRGERELIRRTPEQERDLVINFLLGEYAKMLDSRDWITRAFGSISYGRLPDNAPASRLIQIARTDNNELVRIVAWQALLARASLLHEEHFIEWQQATFRMAEQGLFRGRMREHLFDVLAICPPSNEAQRVWMRYFNATNSLDSADIGTLQAMGRCLAAWKSTSLVEQLIGRMSNLDDAYRAEYILRQAGSPVPAATTHIKLGSQAMWSTTIQAYRDWWASARSTWGTPVEQPRFAWQRLRTGLLPQTQPRERFDPNDRRWREDLELGDIALRSFDVGIAVDATGSMGEVLEWLKRDVRTMMRAFGIVSREPRIAITAFRDHGDEFVTRSTPLTNNPQTLLQFLDGIDAKGGGDIPEAVLEGLTELYQKNRWSGMTRSTRKVLLLIGDAPPQPGTEDAVYKLIADAAEKGFVTYPVKVSTQYGSHDLTTFDRIAEAGSGVSIPVSFGEARIEWDGETRGRSPHAKARIAPPRSQNAAPGEKILREILMGAINPQFKDRVAPFVEVVLSFCEDSIPEKREPFGPIIDRPPPVRIHGPGPAQPRPPPPPREPFDPQKR